MEIKAIGEVTHTHHTRTHARTHTHTHTQTHTHPHTTIKENEN